MGESAQIVSKTLGLMGELIEPGITPIDLDKRADEFIRDHGGIPGFLGLYDYPKSIITSVNEQIFLTSGLEITILTIFMNNYFEVLFFICRGSAFATLTYVEINGTS